MLRLKTLGFRRGASAQVSATKVYPAKDTQKVTFPLARRFPREAAFRWGQLAEKQSIGTPFDRLVALRETPKSIRTAREIRGRGCGYNSRLSPPRTRDRSLTQPLSTTFPLEGFQTSSIWKAGDWLEVAGAQCVPKWGTARF